MMTKRISILFFLLFGAMLTAQTPKQREIDSLLHQLKIQKKDTAICATYNKIARHYLYRNPSEGQHFANRALGLAKKINWRPGEATAYLYLGMLLVSKGQYEEAMRNLKQSEVSFGKQKDVLGLAKVHNEIGILKANQSKFPESLDFFFRSLHNYEKLGFSNHRFGIASCYENIGTVYNMSNTYDKAVEYYRKAIDIRTTLKNNNAELANVMSSLGVVYQKQQRYQKALATFQSAEAKLNAVDDAFSIAAIKGFIGATYLSLGQYDLSIENSKIALSVVTKIGDKQLTANTIANIGNAYLRKAMQTKSAADLSTAAHYLNQSLKMNHELGNQEGLISSYKHLSDYYAFRNDFQKSLEMHQKYALYKDSIFNFKNKQSLQNLEDERAIRLRDKQILHNSATLQSKEREKWIYIAGIAFLLIIAGLVLMQSRNRKKNNEKLQRLNSDLDQANKVKARFFSILNHDLRSPVSNLINFLNLQKESPELLDADAKKRMENKTISSAENLLDSMEDLLLWSKGQMENFEPQSANVTVHAIFEDLQKHFSGVENVQIIFENPKNLNLFTDENYLKTILRNLTGNAIKALEKTPNAQIILLAFEHEGKVKIAVTDNGPGGTLDKFKALYDENEVVGIKTGLGLHLIRDLAKAINCSVSVETQPGVGTTFVVSF